MSRNGYKHQWCPSGLLSRGDPCQMITDTLLLTVDLLGRVGMRPEFHSIAPEAKARSAALSSQSESQAVAQVRLATGEAPTEG